MPNILKIDKKLNTKTFVPNPKQSEFIYNTAKHVLFAGGVRAGKTLAACFKVALLARMYPNNLILVGRQQLPQLRETTMRTMTDLLIELGWRYEPKVAQNLIVFPNKSTIMFAYLESFEARMGLDLGAIFIDQIEDIKEEVYNALLTRLSRDLTPTDEPQFQTLVATYGKAWQRITIQTTNMTPEDHWVFKRWKTNHTRWEIGHPEHNPRYYLVECATDVNAENLPPDYFDTLKDMPKDMVDRYRWGLWGGRSGKIYADEWNDELSIISENTPFPEEAEFYRSYDHGGMADAGACVFGYLSPNPYDGELEWIIFDLYWGEKQTIAQHARNILKLWNDLDFQMTLADPQVKHRTQQSSVREEAISMIDVYRDNGLFLIPAFRPVKAGVEKARRWMHVCPARPHRFLKDPKGRPIKGAPHLYVHKHLWRLIEQIKSAHWSEAKPDTMAQTVDDARTAMRFLLASPVTFRGGTVVDKKTYAGPLEEAIDREFEQIEAGEVAGEHPEDPYYLDTD